MRRQKEHENSYRMLYLHDENLKLKAKLEVLTKKLDEFEKMMFGGAAANGHK